MRINFDLFNRVLAYMKIANQEAATIYVGKFPDQDFYFGAMRLAPEDAVHIIAAVHPHPSCTNQTKQEQLLDEMRRENIVVNPKFHFEAPCPDLPLFVTISEDPLHKYCEFDIVVPQSSTTVHMNLLDGKSIQVNYNPYSGSLTLSFSEPVRAENCKKFNMIPAEIPTKYNLEDQDLEDVAKGHIRTVEYVTLDFVEGKTEDTN